jgi:hypothetical protein
MSKAKDWKKPASAPRDGSLFLGDFGYPWPLPTLWNPHDEQWVCAIVQACEMENGKLDCYLEMDTESEGQLLRWCPMPELPAKASKPS